MKALTKTDRLFLALLAAACLFHLFFLFGPPLIFDEAFHTILPFRLVQGESLVQDEWHLTQFSTLFSYLPVRIWYMLRGSTDGLIVFIRCLYLAIHTAAAVLIYVVFRKNGKPAIAASMVFYLQTPYRLYSISYLSMFTLFLLLFSLSLLQIYDNGAKKHCFAAGFSFGACCVSNPLFCTVSLLYPLLYYLWAKRSDTNNTAAKRRTRKNRKTKKTKASGKKAVVNNNTSPLYAFFESCGCFFSRQTFHYAFLGLTAIAALSVLFFFGTGGTLSSLFQNLKYLFSSSEYQLASLSMREKFVQLWNDVNKISFHMPFLLPLLFLVMLADKKRKDNTHRIAYLSASLLLSALFLFGTIFPIFTALISSLPFFLLSNVCYLLTERKNQKLFICMWCPCAVAAIVSFFASNTLLSSINNVLAIGNVVGVFFAWDLLNELRPQRNNNDQKQKSSDKQLLANRVIIRSGLILQVLVYAAVLLIGQPVSKDDVKITKGPLSGIRMPESQYETYETLLRDLDIVKASSEDEDPLLIIAFQNWLYLYAERPIAAHTAWFTGNLKTDNLLMYYKVNPGKRPKYIYVVNSMVSNIDLLRDLFTFTEEKLSGGVLLKVTNYKFDLL